MRVLRRAGTLSRANAPLLQRRRETSAGSCPDMSASGVVGSGRSAASPAQKERAKPRPSIVSLHAALGCLVRQRDHTRAEGLLRSMPALSVAPNLRTYSLVLAAHAAAGDGAGARALWREAGSRFGAEFAEESVLAHAGPTLTRASSRTGDAELLKKALLVLKEAAAA
ncbi:hypothetical protein DIPPA_10895 [Diplonema papillatum]|nr:hypothetical protein DIPPA_10895 [Diplonema papillatum]